MTTRRPRTEELLAAYASGAELTDEERASVEALLAGSPAARDEVAAIGGLLGDLRELAPEPPPANEAVVRAVRIACAQPVTPGDRVRAWWRRRWKAAVPGILASTALAAVALVAATREPAAVQTTPGPIANEVPAGPPTNPAPAPADDDPIYLAGATTELADLDDDSADEIEQVLGDELAAIGDEADPEDVGFDGILPDDALDWVDTLDDETALELDRWLAEQPS